MASVASPAAQTVARPASRPVNDSRRRLVNDIPDGAILHFDADIDPYTEQTGGPHTFEHAILSPQYQLQPDGSYTDVGAKPAVDVYDGEKWLRSCGAVTNLFNGDTSQARSVSLTNGTVYTLHVFGAGTVSCSYGTATVEAPLKITATATESVTFTPSGATYWMLTATSCPVPYVPPGVTQPASNATTTNGMWFTLPDGSPLWQALDGKPDGVELVTNGGFDSAAGWSLGAAWEISNGALRGISPVLTYNNADVNSVAFIAGQMYKISFDIATVSGTVQIRTVSTGTSTLIGSSLAGNSRITLYLTALTGDHGIRLQTMGSGFVGSIDNISIQRIQPQPLTLATRVRMGVGSGDLVGVTATQNILAWDTTTSKYAYAGNTVEASSYIFRVNDGTLFPNIAGVTWSRNSIIRRYAQVSSSGLRFRVGYMIEGVHTTVQWSHPNPDETTWPLFDGSFNPSTLYRLMLGFNNAYPMWFNKITAWKEEVSDARILEAMS